MSGVGNFGYWIDRHRDHYRRKTGMALFPGTLNVELARPFRFPPGAPRLEKEELGGDVSVILLPCRIFGREAYMLRTDRAEAGRGFHPRTVVEVACEVKLREIYGLHDGDVVEVEVPECAEG